MQARVDAAVTELQSELGDDLRGVFWGNFPQRDYAKAYLPPEADDVDPTIIIELIEYLVDEQLPAENPSHSLSDELSTALGDFQLSVRIFTNRALCLAWNHNDSIGIFVGTTVDADLSVVTRTIISALDNKLSERIDD